MRITDCKLIINILQKKALYTLLSLSFIGFVVAAPISKKDSTYVDVMFLYSAGVEREAGEDAQTLIDHRVAVTNKAFSDSGLNIVIRNVHSIKVSTSDRENTRSVLKRLRLNQGEFTGVAEKRKRHGADMVAMLRPYAGDRICGLAYLGGYGRRGNMAFSKKITYSHTSITACGDYVLAHELGHNMGLHHSRRQASGGGTLPYATGYGVDGQFVTIMAYFSAFKTRTKVYKFSSPSLTCKGVPCGISQGDPRRGANAVEALRKTVPQIAQYYPSNQNKEHDKNTSGVNNYDNTKNMTKLFEYLDIRRITLGGRPVDKVASLPQGASKLVVMTSGGTGDCDLYAHNKSWPLITDYTHNSVVVGSTNEKILINNPDRFYILSLFAGRSGCEDVTMKAYYQ